MFHNSELLPKQSFNSLNFPRLIHHQSLSDICRIETSLELKELMLVNQAKYKSVITFYLCLSSLRKFDKNLIKLICERILNLRDWIASKEIKHEMGDLYVQIDGKKRLRTQLESKLNITKKR
jgi:uncharacterized protein (UPF0262 family)